MKNLIAAVLAAAIAASAAYAQDRQQQTDQLIQNLTNYSNSPSSVGGAQSMVSQSDSFSNGSMVTMGPTVSGGGAGGGLLGQQASGQLGAAADPQNPQTLSLINGITSKIQGTTPVTSQAQVTTQPINQSRPVQTQTQGVNYQSNGIFYAGATNTASPRQGGMQQRALVGTVGGQYQAGP